MYLSQEDINEIIDKMVDLGLSNPAMVNEFLREISPRYIATLPIGSPTPRLQLRAYLLRMNVTTTLPDGTIALLIFLESVVSNVSSQEDIAFFDAKIEKVEARALMKGNPTDLPATTAAAPPVSPIEALDLSAATLDLTPEAEVGGQDDTLSIDFFKKTMEVSRSVFKVLVHRHFDTDPNFISGEDPEFGLGTGWVIGDRLMITNHHVVEARGRFEAPAEPEDFVLQGQNTYIIPDYHTLSDADKMIKLDESALLAYDKELDFAIYQLPENYSDRAPLKLRRRNIEKSLSNKLADRVNIVQHPMGKPQRVGFRNNFIVVGDDRRLSYLTDTEGGSSGSPVCDDKWKVAALHRATKSISAQNVKINGALIRRENTGVPIRTILAHLEAEHPEIHAIIES